MRRVKQSSIDRLNLLLEVDDLVEGLRLERGAFELTETDLRFPCPLHPPEPSDPRSARIDRVTRYGWCRSGRCPFNPGGSLLWLYSRALRQDLADVAEALAARKKLMLEYEFWMGDTGAPQTEAFAYVEAAGGEGGAGEVLAIEDVPAFVNLHPDGARVSPLRFEVRLADEVRERRRQETLPLLGNLYALLRAVRLPGARGGEEGLDLALADARFVCRELMERFRVPEEAVLLRFCPEGVQIEVDCRIFGAQPDPLLARVYRRMAFLLGGVDEQAPARPLPGGGSGHPARCPTLAQDAYRHDFQWQCEGSRGGADGLYAIWISVHELMEKEARYLRELAREPRRPLDPPLRLSLERLARGLFLCAQEREARARPLAVSLLGQDLAPPARADAVAGAAAPGAGTLAAQAGAPGGRASSGPAPAAGVAVQAPAPARASRESARSTRAKEGSMTSAGSGSPPARGAETPRRPAAPPPAPRATAPPRPAAPAGPLPASSLADLLARLTSRDQAAISIAAFGSKSHPGDGLNQVLQGGLHVGQVVGLVGATGEGKTTFALQLADGVAFDNLQRERESQPTVPVLFLSGQMRPEALLMKSLSRLAKLDSGDILRGKSQAKDLQEAMRVYQSFHRHMNVRPSGPDPDLDGVRRAVEATLGAGARAALLVVDPVASLASLDPADAGGARAVCRRLQALARDLPVAVVAVVSCSSAGRGGPLDYAEETAPLAEWMDVVLGLKTDLDLERAGGVLSLDERVGWKREWKAELKRKADASPLKRGGIDYREAWKTEYSVLMMLKSRWQNLVHTAYYFHKSVHRFEEI